MRITRRIRFSHIALTLILLPLVASSSSFPPPGHLFTLHGYVVPPSGQSVANYTVVMMARGGGCGSEGMWARLSSRCEEFGYSTRDVVITPPNGRYFLSVFTCCPPESIAAAIVLPDTLIVSQVVLTKDLRRSELEKQFSYVEEGFVCDDTVIGTHTTSYLYEEVDSLNIPVP